MKRHASPFRPLRVKAISIAVFVLLTCLAQAAQPRVAEGRSTPGLRQTNTTPVVLPTSKLSAGLTEAPPSISIATKSSRNPFAAAGQDRPNFLLLLSDDQTHRALGLLHELEVKTPNLDRLAKRGLLFTHCFNQGGWSGAVCIPSRTMLNTGRTLWHSSGPKNEGIAIGAALWGETLGNAGYDTFMDGK